MVVYRILSIMDVYIMSGKNLRMVTHINPRLTFYTFTFAYIHIDNNDGERGREKNTHSE